MDEDPEPAPAPSLIPAGARCAHHPERTAVRTCTRCGNYLCADCDQLGLSGLCLACATRTGAVGFPFNRDNYTLDGLLNFALSRWKPHWLQLAASTLVFMILAYVPAIVFELFGEGANFAQGGAPRPWLGPWALFWLAEQVVMTVTQLAASLVLSGYWLDLLEGKPASVAASLARLRALPAQLLTVLIIAAVVGVCAAIGWLAFALSGGVDNLPESAWAVLTFIILLLPGIVFGFTGVAFITFELAHDPSTSALASLQRSWALAAGRRWQIGGVLAASGAITWIGSLACCVGLLATFPLGMMLYGALFLALKSPAAASALPSGSEAWPV